jgi:heme/copper-type cytochrome/quinol oxidase subunit 2
VVLHLRKIPVKLLPKKDDQIFLTLMPDNNSSLDRYLVSLGIIVIIIVVVVFVVVFVVVVFVVVVLFCCL